ncbi:MAG: CPBP family intramembrane glutamic endopeptidase [Planctomycetota bacterium]
MTVTSKQPDKWLVLGLSLSLFATTLFWFPPVAGNLLPTGIVARNVCSQAIDWGVAFLLIAIVVFGECKPISSLGFKRPKIETLYEAFGLVGFFFIGMVGWKLLVSPWFPDIPLPSGKPAAGELPKHFFFWYAPLSLLTSSFAEEIIYRGYAMKRLLESFASPWPGILVPHTAFALMHLKDGLENAAMAFCIGSLMTWYFYKTKNLTLLILAHFIIDLLAIVGSLAGVD